MIEPTAPFAAAIEYLYSLQKYGIKFGLSKTENLLRDLGHPERLGRHIHIGGTNGKGSVAAFLSSILRESGYRVGLFTSPHLVSFTERFQVNGRPISKEDVAELTHRIQQVISDEEPPTFFEAVTAMAFCYFQQQETDVNIIEVGLGGRLDATNVITPLLSIITNISLEHQEFLGRTLREVAFEKAGIIKPGVPLVTGARQKAVRELFQAACLEKQAPFFRLGSDFWYRTTASGLQFKGRRIQAENLKLSLSGRHQGRNAALALAAAEILSKHGLPAARTRLRPALEKAEWPGRMHVVSRQPLILLDGGHNPAALRALAESVRTDLVFDRLVLVLGIMADKDANSILKNILPIADRVIYSRPVYERALDPNILARKAGKWKIAGEVVTPLDAALNRARELAGPSDCILVTGSLFTVGEALGLLLPEDYPADVS